MRVWALAGLLVLLVLASAGTSAAAVRSCQTAADFNLHISSARGMSCRAAARDIRAFKHSISTHFTTPGGFACGRVAGGRLSGQWRCVRGAKAYRFEFSD